MKKQARYIKAEEKVECPVCRKSVLIAQARVPGIEWYARSWGPANKEDLIRDTGFKNWCCLDCLEKGRVILPDYDKQNYGAGGPRMLYRDKYFICQTCKEDFDFSAKEQKHWFEELRFIIYVYPKNCPSCRSKIRAVKLAHKQLAELLKADIKTPDQLLAISKLYEELGIEHKAENYKAQAKNKLK